MSLLRIPQTRVEKKLGQSTVVAWDLSNCISVETKADGADLDLSKRKVLPTHIVIEDGDHSASSVSIPSAKLHQGRAVTVINKDTTENVDVGGVSVVQQSTAVIYSDGNSWLKLNEIDQTP